MTTEFITYQNLEQRGKSWQLDCYWVYTPSRLRSTPLSSKHMPAPFKSDIVLEVITNFKIGLSAYPLLCIMVLNVDIKCISKYYHPNEQQSQGDLKFAKEYHLYWIYKISGSPEAVCCSYAEHYFECHWIFTLRAF